MPKLGLNQAFWTGRLVADVLFINFAFKASLRSGVVASAAFVHVAHLIVKRKGTIPWTVDPTADPDKPEGMKPGSSSRESPALEGGSRCV